MSEASVEEKEVLYQQLCHAMQTGVRFEMETAQERGVREPSTEPKHLRVGINSAMSDHAALVELLVNKGLFTREEYLDSLIKFMRQEVKTYEERLSGKYGKNIILH